MLQQVLDFFRKHSQFYSHGHTTTFFFKSYPQGSWRTIIDSEKPHGSSHNVTIEVAIYTNDQKCTTAYGVELKISMYLWSYQQEETMFQGWVESIEELKVICKAVGIKV